MAEDHDGNVVGEKVKEGVTKAQWKKCVEMLRGANKVAVFTGAGVSAESGIPTFRGTDGLWKKYRAEELATPYAFSKNPKLVWEWYEMRRELIDKAEFVKGK